MCTTKAKALTMELLMKGFSQCSLLNTGDVNMPEVLSKLTFVVRRVLFLVSAPTTFYVMRKLLGNSEYDLSLSLSVYLYV